MAKGTLQEKLQQADEGHYALGHFNFSELVVLKAVASAARDFGHAGCRRRVGERA